MTSFPSTFDDLPGREFQFTSSDFDEVRRLIREHAGISLGDSKLDLVYGRLSRRLRAKGFGSFSEYLKLLKQGDQREWEAFINALTTNHTAFFREAHHFGLLAEQLRTLKDKREIVLWCSATSSGEEAYSMAMTAVEVFGSWSPPVTILASDIDTEVLETAKIGIYPAEKVSRLGPAQREQYFLSAALAGASDAVQVRDEVRRLVTFRQINLLSEKWPIRAPIDAIFCRNVMIYFDRSTQYGILKKFAPLLHRDGLLYAGHSERFSHAEDCFRLRGKTVYELAPSWREGKAP